MKRWSSIFLLYLMGALLSLAHADYVGYWKERGATDPIHWVMEIVKEGDEYLLIENTLTRYSSGRKREPSKPVALLKSSKGDLYLSNDISDLPVELSEDKNTLTVGGARYVRISQEEVVAIQKAIEDTEKERQAAE